MMTKDGKPVNVTYDSSKLSSQSDQVKNEIEPSDHRDRGIHFGETRHHRRIWPGPWSWTSKSVGSFTPQAAPSRHEKTDTKVLIDTNIQ